MHRHSNYETIGIGIIFNDSGEILIDKRLEEKSLGGLWEFPGGKQEANENIKETISREIREELNIEVRVNNKLLSFYHRYSDQKLFFVVYLCDFISGKPESLESQSFLWVQPKHLVKFPFPAANTRIIKSLFEYLGLDL